MDFNLGSLHINLLDVLAKIWLPIVEVSIGVVLGPRLKRWIMKASKKAVDPGAMTFLASIVEICVFALFGILALEELGVNLRSIVSLVSALGLGVALALKNNMANVAGGLQILLTKPFVIGDYISTPNHKGIVTSVELMYSTIRTNNNKEVVVPNSALITDSIVNHSHNPFERLKIVFPVNTPIDLPSIQKEVEAILAQEERIIKEPKWELTVKKIHSGYANLLLIIPCTAKDYQDLTYSINKELIEKLSVYQQKKS